MARSRCDIEHDFGWGRDSHTHVNLTPAKKSPVKRDGTLLCSRALKERGPRSCSIRDRVWKVSRVTWV